MFVNANLIAEEDRQTGWIYVLKTQSKNPELTSTKDLYKIGFSSTSVDERIKNAKNEATYLFADVKKMATYKCYNHNADKLESLLHRFLLIPVYISTFLIIKVSALIQENGSLFLFKLLKKLSI